MCGLAFFNGSKPANLHIMVTLGILNEERGTHSCGLYMNGEILWGVNKEAHFREFAAANEFKYTGEDYNVLIHTRASTFGSHTQANAHPFGIKREGKKVTFNEKAPYEFVGMHNGSLDEVYDLRKGYPELSDQLMDSKVLLGRLFLDGNLDVLKDYKGAAALAWTTGPNQMIVFKGAGGNIEERPLYYCQQPEGLYFASMEKSLKTVFGKVEVTQVENNQVLYLENGIIVNTETVDRPKTTVIKTYPNYSNNKYVAPTREKKHSLNVHDVLSTTPKKRVYMHLFRNYFSGNFLDGEYYLDKTGKKNPHGELRYFIEGIEFVDKESYQKFREEYGNWDIKELSSYTTHPITTLQNEKFWLFNSGFIYWKADLYDGEFTYPFTRDLTLEVMDGDVKGIVIDKDQELIGELETLANKISGEGRNNKTITIGLIVQQICDLNEADVEMLMEKFFLEQ